MNKSRCSITLGVVVCLVLSFCTPSIVPGPVAAQPADSPWPMCGQNPQRTGESPYNGPEISYLMWSFTSGDWVYSSSAIGADGTIYVGSLDNDLYAINPDGSEKWRFTTGERVYSSPAIGADGTIYVGSYDHKLYAITEAREHHVTISLVTPAAAATNVHRTNIGFTWSALGETDFFDWLLSANADLSDPIEVRERLAHTACTSTVTLDYETTYYWQVTAWRDGDMVGQSNISTFTTMPEPPPPPEVGVKAGDWIKSEYKISGWPDDQPYPEWLKLEFLSVEGTSTSVRATMRMSDGTEETDTVPVEVGGGAEASGLSGFIIPANSEVGDSIVMGGFGITFADALIEGETTGAYARADRTVVYAGVSQHGVELTYYWDKQTGVMVEASSAYGDMVGTARATETNMWEASTVQAPWWLWVIIAIAIAGGAFAVYRLRRKKKPTAPILPPEGS